MTSYSRFLLISLIAVLALALAAACGQSPDLQSDPTASPTPPPQVTATVTPVPISSIITHKIEEGDTLYAIAQKYGVSVKELLDVNTIPNPNSLTVGQEIVIPNPEFRAQLTPLPTSAPVDNGPFRASAWVSRDFPYRKSALQITGMLSRYGVGVQGATMHVVVHYPGGDQAFDGSKPSGIGGECSVTLTVPDIQPGDPIKVDVTLKSGDQTYQVQTQFRPI